MGKYYSEAAIYDILNNIIINIIKEATSQLCKDLEDNQNIITSKDIALDVIKYSDFLQNLIQNDYIQNELNIVRNIVDYNIDVIPLARKLLYSRIDSKIEELLESYSYSVVAYDMIFEKKLYLEKVCNSMNKKIMKIK